MAITIDNSNYINNDYDRHGVPSGQTESVRDSGSRYVSSGGGLAPGQTVTGEIIERDGENVTVRFGQNQTISAKLQGNADIEVGMKLTFEVAKGANNQIALRPLYSNLANNNAAMSALRAAGLPINDTTLAMTDKMMTESMPVNRNALAEMFRNVSAHQNVSPESIVQMTKLNMPLTESNVIQFDNYRNFMHQITNDLQNVSEGVADLFREAVSATQEAQGNVPQQFGNLSAAEVINEVLDLIDTESLDAIKMPQSVTGDATGASQPVAADASPDAAVTADAKSETDPASNVTQSVQSDTQNAVLHEAVTVTEDAASTVKNTFEGLLSGIREMFTPDAPDTNTAVNTNLSLTPAEQVTLSGDVQELLILAGESSDIH